MGRVRAAGLTPLAQVFCGITPMFCFKCHRALYRGGREIQKGVPYKELARGGEAADGYPGRPPVRDFMLGGESPELG